MKLHLLIGSLQTSKISLANFTPTMLVPPMRVMMLLGSGCVDSATTVVKGEGDERSDREISLVCSAIGT